MTKYKRLIEKTLNNTHTKANDFHNTTKHPKNCLRIVFNIQEKLETVSVQNFRGETKQTFGNLKVASGTALIQRLSTRQT